MQGFQHNILDKLEATQGANKLPPKVPASQGKEGERVTPTNANR